MAVAGVGAWFPVTAPALWALDPSAVSAGQLALVATVPLLFGGLTIGAWRRLQLDR
jgi:ABC-2 type transport system permease protein